MQMCTYAALRAVNGIWLVCIYMYLLALSTEGYRSKDNLVAKSMLSAQTNGKDKDSLDK